MKNIIKKINVLAVMAMLVAGGMAFAANKTAQFTNDYFGQDESGVWHRMSDLEPGEYTCEDTGICYAEYSADPSLPNADPEQLRIPNTSVIGTLKLNTR